MRLSNKIILLVFAMVMLCALSVVAYADITIEISDVEVTLGEAEAVDVTVSFSGVSEAGLGCTELDATFSTGLVLNAKATAASTFRSGFTAGNDITANPYTLTWYANDAIYTDGLFATLTFKVPEEAGEYTVTISNIYSEDGDFNMPDIADATGTITVNAAETPEATLTAAGQNLIIDGGVNAKVYFDYTGTGELTINDKPALEDANGYYAVIAVSPKDYANKITFTATDGTLTASHNVSVQDILDLYDGNAIYAAEQELVTALNTYCSYAATYFADGTVPAVDATVVAATPTIAGTQTGVTLNSTSLILRDKVALRHYFNVEAGTDVEALGLTALDATHAYVEYANINAADLADEITTTVGGITIKFAPLAYANLDIDANTANLVKALYNLHVEAVEYAAN